MRAVRFWLRAWAPSIVVVGIAMALAYAQGAEHARWAATRAGIVLGATASGCRVS